MKKIIAALIVTALASTALIAEDEISGSSNEKSGSSKPVTKTLIPAGSDLTFSGYGAPTVGVSQINGNWVTTAGFRGGLIINGLNQGMVIGFSGEGVAYPNGSKTITGENYPAEQDSINIGWGGLLLEWHIFPRSLVNFSIGTTIGAGSINLYDGDNYDENNDNHGDTFFVAEPEIGAYVNITKFCRIGAAASYRYVNGVNTDGLSDANMSNFGGKVLFEFGWF